MRSKLDFKQIDELALAIGHLYGDGGITNKGVVHYCNAEDFLIKEFIGSMSKAFNIKPWIKRESNVIRVRYPMHVGRMLWDIFGKFSSGKDTKIITFQIQNMSLEWKVRMLQAFFNDDGSVSNIPPNYKVISFKQKLKPLVEFVIIVLNELGINSILTDDKGKWQLRICGYENIKKFKERIGFSQNYRKMDKLNMMFATINRPHMITKKKILSLLNTSSRTLEELSKLLNMNGHVIYGHLHGWKRKFRKSNLGLIELGAVKLKKEGRCNIYIINKNENKRITIRSR